MKTKTTKIQPVARLTSIKDSDVWLRFLNWESLFGYEVRMLGMSRLASRWRLAYDQSTFVLLTIQRRMPILCTLTQVVEEVTNIDYYLHANTDMAMD